MARRPREPDGPVYAFPTRSRCTRCGSVRTRRTSARSFARDGRRQYRVCASCGRRYCVLGKLI